MFVKLFKGIHVKKLLFILSTVVSVYAGSFYFGGSKAQCEIIEELHYHPNLKSFPVAMCGYERGYVTLCIVESFAYSRSKSGGDIGSMFNQSSDWDRRKNDAVRIISKIKGVKDVSLRVYDSMNTARRVHNNQFNTCKKEGHISN